MIRKMHEFLVEADVTVEEWMAACNLMVQAGKVSSEQRNEVVLVTDIFGIESLVGKHLLVKIRREDIYPLPPRLRSGILACRKWLRIELTQLSKSDTLDQTRGQRAAKAADTKQSIGDPTFSAILGPFYRTGVPVQANGTTIIRVAEDAPYCHLFGTIYGQNGKPLENALVDIWHDAPDGRYDAQSPEKPDYHCRGRFRTDSEGRYDTVCLKPTPYPIPFDCECSMQCASGREYHIELINAIDACAMKSRSSW